MLLNRPLTRLPLSRLPTRLPLNRLPTRLPLSRLPTHLPLSRLPTRLLLSRLLMRPRPSLHRTPPMLLQKKLLVLQLRLLRVLRLTR